MAQRPIFIPQSNPRQLVLEPMVTFEWHPGMALSQKQKSIRALHQSAGLAGPLLEVSSKSENPLGRALSAFNLSLRSEAGLSAPVECFFQGSKQFRQGGPFTDLYQARPIDAKRDERLKVSGDLQAFVFSGMAWPLQPQSAFYDWLYLNALQQQPRLMEAVQGFAAFTDIEFNPKVSINCQARSVALCVALHQSSLFEDALRSPTAFLDQLGLAHRVARPFQQSFGF
ncbi:MAG: hypothetical protein HQL47_09670 [Gammaproteobacteria bacterium]|nr:hypothetical protein [Gammaproteobacteria bacterium]